MTWTLGRTASYRSLSGTDTHGSHKHLDSTEAVNDEFPSSEKITHFLVPPTQLVQSSRNLPSTSAA
jgi:hypothetical protein